MEMGLDLWKLNNTGNQIEIQAVNVDLTSELRMYSESRPTNISMNRVNCSSVGRKMAHTLFIRAVVMIWNDSPNVISVNLSVKKKNIWPSVLSLASPLFYRDHEISDKYDCYISGQCIKGIGCSIRWSAEDSSCRSWKRLLFATFFHKHGWSPLQRAPDLCR